MGVHLAEVYTRKTRYCVILVSPEYAGGKWPTHEFQSALARAIEERGAPYILPIIVRDAEIPGLRSTISYQRLTAENTIERIGEQLIQKLKAGA